VTSNDNSFELELYGARTGNCRRAAISLEEAGLAYRVRQVDLAGGAQRSSAHLALNPAAARGRFRCSPVGIGSCFLE